MTISVGTQLLVLADFMMLSGVQGRDFDYFMRQWATESALFVSWHQRVRAPGADGTSLRYTAACRTA